MNTILFILLFIVPVCADFVVISDIHYDQLYMVGSPTKCFLGDTGMGCCRNSSIPLKGSTPALKFGEFTCDSPQSLLDITFEWLTTLSVDYLVFLGDIVDHDLLIQNSTYNLKEISTLGKYFKTLPYPTFSLMGNHDSFMVDNLWDDDRGREWLRTVQIEYGNPTNLGIGGYYSVMKDNKRFIFLNCLGYDTHNIEIMKNPRHDMFNQSIWFAGQIDEVKKLNQTVYLFSHFGSETGEATDYYNMMISSINYPNIVYFAGHSHHDEIRPMTNTTFFYINPSLVPDKHFPEVRVYVENNGAITDYIQYGFNLTSANLGEPTAFEIVYSAKESYTLSDLSPKEWIDFINRMQTNKTLEALYNYHENWGF